MLRNRDTGNSKLDHILRHNKAKKQNLTVLRNRQHVNMIQMRHLFATGLLAIVSSVGMAQHRHFQVTPLIESDGGSLFRILDTGISLKLNDQGMVSGTARTNGLANSFAYTKAAGLQLLSSGTNTLQTTFYSPKPNNMVYYMDSQKVARWSFESGMQVIHTFAEMPGKSVTDFDTHHNLLMYVPSKQSLTLYGPRGVLGSFVLPTGFGLFGMSDNDVVIGEVVSNGGGNLKGMSPVAWSPSLGLLYMPALQGTQGSSVLGINSIGTVCGASYLNNSAGIVPYVWQPGGNPTQLIGADNWSYAEGVSSNGLVVGESDLGPVYWDAPDNPLLLDDMWDHNGDPTLHLLWVSDVNSKGQIVGFMSTDPTGKRGWMFLADPLD